MVVGIDVVRPHRAEANDGDWHYCGKADCDVVYYLGAELIDHTAVVTQVGTKASEQPTPVCFCFAYTTEALAEDLCVNRGVSQIKAQIKNAVAASSCSCMHLNPRGECCLPDVHRALSELESN